MIRYHETLLEPACDIVEPDFDVSRISHRLDGGIYLDTVTADGRLVDNQPTMIVTLPWSEFVARPDAKDRYAAIAQELEMRVIAIDNVGVSGKSRMPRSLGQDIKRGNFDGVSMLQWEALMNVDVNLGKSALAMFSYSLGGAIAMSLAKNAPRDLRFKSLVLAETVGVRPMTLKPLTSAFLKEMEAWKKYWPENPEWMHKPGNDPKMLGRMATHIAGHLTYPLGLTQGSLLDMVEVAVGHSVDEDTTVHVISGEKSTVSSVEDNAILAAKFNELGVSEVTQDVLLSESHGMIDSVNRLVPALENVLYRD